MLTNGYSKVLIAIFEIVRGLKKVCLLPHIGNRHPMLCKHCKSSCIRKGIRNNIQKYRCKRCGKYSQERYIYNSYTEGTDHDIVLFVKEGMGIKSIGRVKKIPPKTLISKTLKIRNLAKCPFPYMQVNSYGIDEMFTYVGHKKHGKVCIAYALERKTGYVIDIMVGSRTKLNLSKVVDTVLLRNPKRIRTDKLDIYGTLIPDNIHFTKCRGINTIECKNLTLRTHLK